MQRKTMTGEEGWIVMTGREIFEKLVGYIVAAPQLFPSQYSESWSHSFEACLLHLGRQSGYEVRCGDYYGAIVDIMSKRGLPSLPEPFAELGTPWLVHGLLDIDVCWVTTGFSIPRDFQTLPTPQTAEIVLAFEHEDEATTFRDTTGTNLIPVLDEIRKIGSVRAGVKVISYITSQSEAQGLQQIQAIQDEIRLVPPRSRKTLIVQDQKRHVFIRMVSLDSSGSQVHVEDRLVPCP